MPRSGSVRFLTNHLNCHVRCGLVDRMISNFSELHGWQGTPYLLLLMFTLCNYCLATG